MTVILLVYFSVTVPLPSITASGEIQTEWGMIDFSVNLELGRLVWPEQLTLLFLFGPGSEKS